MYEVINQKIDVVAVFGKDFRDVRPFKIKWNNREHLITKIGYAHKIKEGHKIIHIFSCTDGSNFFELRFDTDNLQWFIGRTWDGEST